MKMPSSAGCCLGLWVTTLGPATVLAQPGLKPAAEPGNVRPVAKYESSFSDYRPFREQELRSWTEVNKEVADNSMGHAMGTMKGMAGHSGHGAGAQGAPGPAGAPAHDMAAMKDSSGKAAGHQHGKVMKDTAGEKGVHGHDAGAVKDETRKPSVAMVNPNVAPRGGMLPRPAHASGLAVVQAIDKANGKIKLTHEPIAALNWPRLTLFFRLKDRALADQVKEGDRVGFSLERQAAGFVISSFDKMPARHDGK